MTPAPTGRRAVAIALVVAVGLVGCAGAPGAPGAPGTPSASGTPALWSTPPTSTLAPTIVSPTASGTVPTSASSSASSSATATGTPSGGPLAGIVVGPAASEEPSRQGAVLARTASGPLNGKKIVVDPGHNGRYVSAINGATVPAGHGTSKVCNTTGTEAVDGTAEHVITWAVGVRLVEALRAQGATVYLTRPNDTGIGPCVDERAKIANRNGVDLVLSIHGDGAEVASARGFSVVVSTRMEGGAALQTGSMRVAKELVTQLRTRTALMPSTYVGGGTGIFERDDIAGLNLLTGAPGVLLEMGNLRSAADWAYLKTPAAQDALALALAATAVEVL